MRKIILMLLAVLITGCVMTRSPNEVRKDMPAVEYSSVNSSKTVALCLTDTWEKINSPINKVQLRPTSNGYSAWVEETIGGGPSLVSVNGRTVILADIEDTQSGSITRYYTSFKPGHAVWQPPVDKCLGGNIAKVVAIPESTTSGVSTSSGNATSQKLRELQALRKDGVITEDEFQSKKKQLLEKL